MKHYYYDPRIIKTDCGQYMVTVYEWNGRKKTATAVKELCYDTYDLAMFCVKVYVKVRNDIAKMGVNKMLRNASERLQKNK